MNWEMQESWKQTWWGVELGLETFLFGWVFSLTSE